MRARRVRVVAAALAVAAAGGCTPLFVPPVPAPVVAAAPAWRLAGDAALRATDVGGRWRLRLRVRFDEVPAAGWVAVQWFGPAGGERASAALRVAPEDVGRVFALDLPADVALVPGPWRALLSVDGRVVRQFEADVPDAAVR